MNQFLNRYGMYILIAAAAFVAIYLSSNTIHVPWDEWGRMALSMGEPASLQQTEPPETEPQPTAQTEPPQEHRPVVVEYRDSTFEDTDRAGFRSERDEYYIAVSYVTEESPPELPTGQKRLNVTTAIGNLSGPAVTIERQRLTLVSRSGERYAPVNDAENSEVLGVQIAADEGVYGFLGFHVPTDFGEGVLEWCPDGAAPCPQPLRAPLP